MIDAGPQTGGDRAEGTAGVGAVAAAHRAFDEARRAGGLREHFRLLGGRPVRFRFAGPAPEHAVSPAFAHLPPARPDAVSTLDAHLWDGASTGSTSPFPPAPSAPRGPAGTRHEYDDGRVCLQWWHGMTGAYDRVAGKLFGFVPDASAAPWFERAVPLRHWVALWARDQGLSVVHAAAVGGDSGAVLLGGPAGSGKSTVSLACVGSALRFAGDDLVLLEPGEPARVHTIYGTAKIEPSGAELVAHVASEFVGSSPSGDAKRVAFVAVQFPEAMLLQAPVRAVLLPVVTGGPTRLERVTAGEALRRVAPNTTLFLPAAVAPTTLGALAFLLRQVPAYRLELGPDIASIPARIGELLDG